MPKATNGQRPRGRGRPPKDASEILVSVGVRFPPDMLEKLRTQAESRDIGWQVYLKQLVEAGMSKGDSTSPSLNRPEPVDQGQMAAYSAMEQGRMTSYIEIIDAFIANLEDILGYFDKAITRSESQPGKGTESASKLRRDVKFHSQEIVKAIQAFKSTTRFFRRDKN